MILIIDFYSYELSNGQKVSESGYLRDIGDPTLVVEGEYIFVSPNGQTHHVRYTADERGFRPNYRKFEYYIVICMITRLNEYNLTEVGASGAMGISGPPRMTRAMESPRFTGSSKPAGRDVKRPDLNPDIPPAI